MMSVMILIGGNMLSAYVMKKDLVNDSVMVFFVKFLQLIILTGLIFFIMSGLYYFGHSAKYRWRFFSPGAIIATALSILATYIFSSFVDDFDSYNKLYGSIGAIIVLMLLIYFNTLCILVGFELNKSITTVVKISQEKRKLANHFRA